MTNSNSEIDYDENSVILIDSARSNTQIKKVDANKKKLLKKKQ